MSNSYGSKKSDKWRERFDRFEKSGLSVVRFCADEGVSVASFYQWRKKLQRQTRSRKNGSAANGTPNRNDSPQRRNGASIQNRKRGNGRSRSASLFQPVTVVPGSTLAIRLPGGTCLEVPLEDLRVLRTVVRVVAQSDAGLAQDSKGGQPC